MRISYLGGDDPEVAILGGIHGDEPCGVTAIERLLDDPPELERAVALVIANEEAIAADKRYLDEDLNRAFPGDPDGDTHETRLAAQLTEEIGDCLTLSLHSTQSYGGMFAVINDSNGTARKICPQLSIDTVVDTGVYDEGRIFAGIPQTIEIECGYQGSARAAENATTITKEFLGAVGALPEAARPPQQELPLFRLRQPIHKERATSYEVFASNFERIEAGEAFAAVDDTDVIADEEFYPVLLSAYGYEEMFGYDADRVGTLDHRQIAEDD